MAICPRGSRLWGWRPPSGDLGEEGRGTCGGPRELLGPDPLRRRPQARGVLAFAASGTKWPRRWRLCSSLGAQSLRKARRSRRPPTRRQEPWRQCIPTLNLCNFALECDRGSRSKKCLRAHPPASPREFGAGAPGEAGGCAGEERLSASQPASLTPHP